MKACVKLGSMMELSLLVFRVAKSSLTATVADESQQQQIAGMQA
jgi:hypothetical protein